MWLTTQSIKCCQDSFNTKSNLYWANIHIKNGKQNDFDEVYMKWDEIMNYQS